MARYVASLANMLGGGVIVQRLGDLLAGRRSYQGAPGGGPGKTHFERGYTGRF